MLTSLARIHRATIRNTANRLRRFPVRQTRAHASRTSDVETTAALLSQVAPPDVHRLLKHVSPLALHARARHANLTAVHTRSALSPTQAEQLRSVSPVVDALSHVTHVRAQMAETESLLREGECDADLKTLANDELAELRHELHACSTRLLDALIASHAPGGQVEHARTPGSRQPDDCNALVEIRAGTGGIEASLFATDLLQMYASLASGQAWALRTLSHTMSDRGGTREVIMHVRGPNALTVLSTEAGVHRVQRVPATETQGRVHTSTATVAVLRWGGESADGLRTSDVKFDVYRASGAGGQHVNTTESAVRATHVPTGLVATCQDERSQHRNRATALTALSAKVAARQAALAAAERTGERRAQLGCTAGERSDRIRTYNFPQRRVTDHRIGVHTVVHALAPSVKEAVGEKSASLQLVLQGGAHLTRLGDSVRRSAVVDRLAGVLERADAVRSEESDRFCDKFIAGV